MNTFKKIISLILAVCSILGALALTSCDKDNGGDKNNENDGGNETVTGYTVTVVDTNGNAVEGVSLMITNMVAVPVTGKTDANGKLTANVEGDGMGVVVSSVPNGFIKPEKLSGSMFNIIFPENSKEVTLTLEKAAVEETLYTVTIKDQNGNSVKDVSLQLCFGGTCQTAPLTDDNGVCTLNLPNPEDVTLKILSVPEGYEKPEATIEGGYHYAFTNGEVRAEIIITKN